MSCVTNGCNKMAADFAIQVSGLGGISNVVVQAAAAFEKSRTVTLTAINSGIPNAVQAAELLKHRIRGLHQLNHFEKVPETNKTRVAIRLSLDPLDTRDKGYQAPLPESQVEAKTLSELQTRPPPRTPRPPREEGKEPANAGSRPTPRPPQTRPSAGPVQAGAPRTETVGGEAPRRGRGGRRGGRGGRMGPGRSDIPNFSENYQKVRPTASVPSVPGDILISNRRPVWVYVKEAVVLFKRDHLERIQLKASGMALAHAVAVAEDIRRAVRSLHQVASFSKRVVVDVFEPVKTGLESITKERSLPTIDIVLSTRLLQTSEPGYQAPLPDSQVKEMSLEEAEKGLSSS